MARDAWEGGGVADVGETGNVGERALETEAEAGVCASVNGYGRLFSTLNSEPR